MRRSKKLLAAFALALALFAIQAVASTAAFAQSAQFRAEEYPATLTGEISVKPVFKVKTGTISCNTTSFAGTEVAASSTLSVVPTYSACKLNSALLASVKDNSCGYVFTNATETAPYGGSVKIECTKAGDAIEVTITGSNCSIKLPAKAPAARWAMKTPAQTAAAR